MSSQWLYGVFVVLALSYGVYGQGLTEEEQEEILNAHNYYRGQVDPVATNMLKMVRIYFQTLSGLKKHTYIFYCLLLQEWNDDLAYLAQFWASGCEYVENEDRNTQSTSFDYIGESFAATVSYTVNYTQLIGQLWYGEKRFFNYYAAACLDENGDLDEDGEFETCGRYTQVAIHVHTLQTAKFYSFGYRWYGLGHMLLVVEPSDVLN